MAHHKSSIVHVNLVLAVEQIWCVLYTFRLISLPMTFKVERSVVPDLSTVSGEIKVVRLKLC